MSFFELRDDILKLAAAISDDQVRKASLLAGLQLYGLPGKHVKADTFSYMKKYGIDPKKYKYHGGSGLIWSPTIKNEVLADTVVGKSEDDSQERGTLIQAKKNGVLVLETNWLMKLDTEFGSYFVEESQGTPKPITKDEVIRTHPKPLTHKGANFQQWLKTHNNFIQVGTFVIAKEDVDRGDLTFRPGITKDEAFGGLSWYEAQKKQQAKNRTRKPTLAEWVDDGSSAFCGTFEYVFFPSTGKGQDEADEGHLLDPRLREKDGHVYLAGSDGIIRLILPPDADAIWEKVRKRLGKR